MKEARLSANRLKMWNFKLEGRNREVLVATVRTFIATGEPVGSRTISRKRRDGISAATVRNIMADLEEAGYLEQPHTSAGRVPTDKAYRYYVEQVARPDRSLNRYDEELIRQEIERAAADNIYERASHVLSAITHNVSLVVAATAAEMRLENIHFVALADARVLVILVPRGAPVRSRVVRIPEDFSQDELNTIANYLNQNFAGWRLEDARIEIVRRLEEERAAYDELLQHVGALYRQGALSSDQGTGVYLEGASHLLGRPELADPELLRELLRALEEKERLVRLLSHYLQAEGGQSTARVVIGLDADPPMKDFALIGAVCMTPDGLAGRVAVLGPPRMQYERAMCAVARVAQLVADAVGSK